MSRGKDKGGSWGAESATTCSLNLPPHFQHHRPSESWHNSAETRLPVEGRLPGAWMSLDPQESARSQP